MNVGGLRDVLQSISGSYASLSNGGVHLFADLSTIRLTDRSSPYLVHQTGRSFYRVSQNQSDMLCTVPRTPVAPQGAERTSLGGLTSAGADDLSEGTSGYDSACSDELSERERRLGRLRRMATDLETLLAPASPAWSDITQVPTEHRQGGGYLFGKRLI